MAEPEAESLTWAVNEYEPLVVGVPEIAPALESVRPGVSEPPLTDHA
jgi:hypothetical protein